LWRGWLLDGSVFKDLATDDTDMPLTRRHGYPGLGMIIADVGKTMRFAQPKGAKRIITILQLATCDEIRVAASAAYPCPSVAKNSICEICVICGFLY